MRIKESAIKGIIIALGVAGDALFFWLTFPVLIEILTNFEGILLGAYEVPQISANVYYGFAVFALFIGVLLAAFSTGENTDSE